MTQLELKELLSLTELPCPEAFEWVKQEAIAEKLNIVQKMPPFWRIFCADKSTDGDVLALLAQDPYWRVRAAAAGNTSTPSASLALLSQDPDPDVRIAAARNRSTPFAALPTLPQDPAYPKK